jgi:hypothetical protein
MAEYVSATANIAGGNPLTIWGWANPNLGIGLTPVADQPAANQSAASQSGETSRTSLDDSVKAATPALVALGNPILADEIMVDLIFENIGGQELINISRNDIVNGQDVLYSPIKNLKDLYIQYNPNNIIKIENTLDTYFKNFPIRLELKLPAYGTGPNEEVVYIDPTTGDLIINVSSLEPDEQVDVEILTDGDILNGTIYEEES